MIPGRMLHRLAVVLCSTKTLHRIVEPAIADLQNEYAAPTQQIRRAWALLRGYVAIAKVIAMCALSVSVAEDDGRMAIVRTMTWSFTLAVLFTALLMLPPLFTTLSMLPLLSTADGDLASISIAALIPQAVPLAIPIGFAFGIALGLDRRTVNRGMVKAILLCALLGSVVSFVTLAWLMPAGNQAYRESIARTAGISRPLTNGPSEMSLSELHRQAAIAAAAGDEQNAHSYAWFFHLRFALAGASVVLAGFLLATAVAGIAASAFISLGACLAYWALIYIGEWLAVNHASAPAFVGAWLPNLTLTAVAIYMVSSRSSRLRGELSSAK